MFGRSPNSIELIYFLGFSSLANNFSFRTFLICMCVHLLQLFPHHIYFPISRVCFCVLNTAPCVSEWMNEWVKEWGREKGREAGEGVHVCVHAYMHACPHSLNLQYRNSSAVHQNVGPTRTNLVSISKKQFSLLTVDKSNKHTHCTALLKKKTTPVFLFFFIFFILTLFFIIASLVTARLGSARLVSARFASTFSPAFVFPFL